MTRVPHNVVVVRVGVRVGTRDTLAAGQVHGGDGAERDSDACVEGRVGADETGGVGGTALGFPLNPPLKAAKDSSKNRSQTKRTPS